MKSRIGWNDVGNKCLVEFFKLIRQNNASFISIKFQYNHGRVFTKKENLDRICYEFYK